MPRKLLERSFPPVGYAAVLAGIYLIELHSYLLFHTIVELFAVCVAFAIFMIVWNGRHFIQNNYMLFLGIAYLFVGGLDLLHALAYSGMGVFPGYGTNLATQLWILARYMESLSLLAAPILLRRRLNCTITLAVFGLLSGLGLLSIFYLRVFPVCFRETTGLTAFKETSELIVIGILLMSLVALTRKKGWFDSKVLRWLIWSIVLTMGSELMFTMYAVPFGRANMVGHFLKLISFYLMYKALIETGMRQPHRLLYKRLKEHEAELQTARDDLEIQVQTRTAELSKTVESLKEEVEERLLAEEAYRESESKYRTLVEQIPAVTYIAALDETSTTIYVSPQAESIMGISANDCRNDPDIWTKRLHPDDRERVLAELAEMRCNDTPFSCEYRFLKPDRSVIWLRDEARLVKDEYDHPRYIQGVTYDITQRKQMEQELAKQSRTLEAFFSHTIMPMAILHCDFGFVRVNQAYAEACQRDISEFAGQNHFALYPHEENQRIFEEVVRTKTPYQAAAKPFSFPDHPEWGTTYWDWTLVPILDEAGEVEFLVFSLRDVTQRRRAELAVIEKEAYLRTVVSSAPVVLFATDRQGKITISEGRGLTALGQAPEESVGYNAFDRYRDHPDIIENMRRALGGEAIAAEVEVVPGRFFDVRYAPVRDEHDRVTGVIGVAVDITEAKEAREAVLAHQEQLRALTTQLLSVEDQERRKIATALHDSVGQILAFLKIELGTLQRLRLPEEAAQAIAHAREQVEEAIRQTRALTFEISPPELYTLGLESALEELSQRFSKERRIDCHVRGRGDCEPRSNQLKTLLYRAVRELLINAAKHARAKTIQIDLVSVNDSVQITVQDDGAGFNPSLVDARSPNASSGYGLFSIRERVTHMGGRMDLRSAPGEGTTVTLTVPLEDPTAFDGRSAQ